MDACVCVRVLEKQLALLLLVGRAAPTRGAQCVDARTMPRGSDPQAPEAAEEEPPDVPVGRTQRL